MAPGRSPTIYGDPSRSSETTDPFNTPPRDARSVRPVTAVILNINPSLDGFVAAEGSRPGGYTCQQDVEGCE
jgi:hypothetical protein